MPDFNKDGSWNPENPESRRYRYIAGLVSYRRNYPSVGPKVLIERMVGGAKWPEMKEMFNQADIDNWLTCESPDSWGFVRCSNSAAEAIRAATRERNAFSPRAELPASPPSLPPETLHPDWESVDQREKALEESGW
jgi:hypothetical protein